MLKYEKEIEKIKDVLWIQYISEEEKKILDKILYNIATEEYHKGRSDECDIWVEQQR